MKRVRLGELRKVVLPEQTEGESIHMQSLRKVVATRHPDSLRLAVADELYALTQAPAEVPEIDPRAGTQET